MRVQRLVQVAAATMLVWGMTACAKEEAKPAEVGTDELLRVMRVEENLTGGDGMADMVIKANPALAPFRDVLTAWADKTINWKTMGPEVTALYEAAFTPAERADIVAFYRTKTGQKLLDAMPKLAESGGAIGMRLGEANQAELQRMLAERAAQLQQGGAAPPAAPEAMPAPAPESETAPE